MEKKADVFSVENLQSAAKRKLLRKNSSSTSSFGEDLDSPNISRRSLQAETRCGLRQLAVYANNSRAWDCSGAMQLLRKVHAHLGFSRTACRLQGDHVIRGQVFPEQRRRHFCAFDRGEADVQSVVRAAVLASQVLDRFTHT